ncbi:MAG: amidase [Burkholderiaceae bacterium]|nr:MAG: amidase [Burkholderiaceae bacterium]
MNEAFDPVALLAAGATACAQALAVRRGGATELCEAAIARIEQIDGALNAVVVRDFDRARAQARAANAALARGERRPLLGVPMTVKESFNVAGLPTTWGLRPYQDFVPTQDAVVVQRLKDAGAVILGKTNVPPGLADWQCHNPIYGRTVHPLDATRTPGGSSGGSAAALAAGMVALEVGSDIGGSIRVPAHFCGVYGHKPSLGLIPGRGHNFPTLPSGAPNALAVVGPLAHCAADLQLALDVLAGPDTLASDGWKLALPSPRPKVLRDWRVLVLAEHPIARASSEVREAVEMAAQALERGGAAIARTSALLPDLTRLHETYLDMLLTLTTRGNPAAPSTLTAYEWLSLLDRRAHLQTQWQALFGRFDAVLCPPFGVTAFTHVDEPDWNARTMMIDGQATPYGAQTAWAGMATLAGLPATVAPVGTAPGGLPRGVQIIGGAWQDRTTIALSQALAVAPT